MLVHTNELLSRRGWSIKLVPPRPTRCLIYYSIAKTNRRRSKRQSLSIGTRRLKFRTSLLPSPPRRHRRGSRIYSRALFLAREDHLNRARSWPGSWICVDNGCESAARVSGVCVCRNLHAREFFSHRREVTGPSRSLFFLLGEIRAFRHETARRPGNSVYSACARAREMSRLSRRRSCM